MEMNRTRAVGHKILTTIAGVVMLIGGFAALANPFAASIAAEQIAGWTFVIAGVFQAMAAFQKGIAGWMRGLFVVLGILWLFIGVSLVKHPLAGVIHLTTLIGILFLFSGGARILFAFGIRPVKSWVLWLVSGSITVALALYMLVNMGGAALVTLGILLAIELISAGIRMLLPMNNDTHLPEPVAATA